MELIRENVSVGELVFSDCIENMTDGDMIVPDVKPDILKVLQVNASAVVCSKEITDGRLTLEGKVNFCVLYLPDRDDCGVQCIKTVFDFTQKLDKGIITDDCSAMISADVSRVDFHVINSRKISLKAVTAIDCRIIAARELSLVTGIGEEKAQYEMKPLTVNSLCGIRDEEFMIKEMLEIPSGKLSAEEILNIEYKICDKELKIITEKIVAKGTLCVSMLYTNTSGNPEYTDMEIPFTEVFDFPDIDESMECELNFRICDSFCELSEDSDGDKRIINFELLISAEMKAECEYNIDIITDCFCPGYETKLDFEEVTVTGVAASPSCQNAIRDVAVIDKNLPQISGVYNVIPKAYISKSSAEDNRLLVEGNIEVYILYITDNSQMPLYSYKKDIPFSYILDSENTVSGMACSVAAEVGHTSYHLNVANEVELRLILNISAEVFASEKVTLISEAELSEIPRDKRKGIVIYFVQPGDTLWMIAKNYCVSVEDIVKYNQVSDKDKIAVGQRLVIPTIGKL